MKKILLSIFFFAFILFTRAQDTLTVNADRAPTGLRAEGKMYVVLVVSVTILTGLFIYLILLDRKITKLERRPDGRRE